MKRYLMGTVKALDDGEDPNGSFEVILSAPTLDRDGEVIDAEAFEPLPDHVTFDIDHGMSVATTVGSGAPSYDDEGRLLVKGTYSSIPRAQEVRTLVREGHIRTTSVAFMDAKREQKDGVTHIVKAELLNGAFVPIPSNRESVVVSAKEYQTKVGARNSSEDTERLQQIHDLAVSNGASCEAKSERSVGAGVSRKFAGGLTGNDLRQALQNAVRALYADDATHTYTWVRDFDEDWFVFEVESNEQCEIYRQGYAVSESGELSLTGNPDPVQIRITYVPAGEPAPQDPADGETPDPESGKLAPSAAAPETPAAAAGKSPASGIKSEYVRARAELAALAT